MLLLYRKNTGYYTRGFIIYIPLCFYFIWPSAPECRLWQGIYIPLCFYFIRCRLPVHLHITHLHSIMLLLYREPRCSSNRRKRIYIPLCFYFIPTAHTITAITSRIYIPLCFYFIQMIQQILFNQIYLHSIMLLLYRQYHFHKRHFDQIYIPLCFDCIGHSSGLSLRREDLYIPLCF